MCSLLKWLRPKYRVLQRQSDRALDSQGSERDGEARSRPSGLNHVSKLVTTHQAACTTFRVAVTAALPALESTPPVTSAPVAIYSVLTLKRCGCVSALLQPLRVVWMEGRRLLKLLNGFFTLATCDLQPTTPQPVGSDAAAAGAGSNQGRSSQQGTAASGAARLSAVDAAAAASEVAVMLSSYLQSFLQAADSNAPSSTLQQQQGPDGSTDPPCYILLAENVFGPHGAVNYMNRVHQQACLNPGRQAASRCDTWPLFVLAYSRWSAWDANHSCAAS